MSKKGSSKSATTESSKPTHGVNELLVMVIRNHHRSGMDLDRIAAITMLSKSKVQEVIDTL